MRRPNKKIAEVGKERWESEGERVEVKRKCGRRVSRDCF